jgi:hypothetical protein
MDIYFEKTKDGKKKYQSICDFIGNKEELRSYMNSTHMTRGIKSLSNITSLADARRRSFRAHFFGIDFSLKGLCLIGITIPNGECLSIPSSFSKRSHLLLLS